MNRAIVYAFAWLGIEFIGRANTMAGRTSIAAIAVILVLGAGALAQAVFGVITGNVTDPTGATIPKAQVTIRDTERGTAFEAPVNDSGGFTQTHLLPGRYEVHVSAPGFAEYVRTVVVQVDSTTRVDVELTVG